MYIKGITYQIWLYSHGKFFGRRTSSLTSRPENIFKQLKNDIEMLMAGKNYENV